MRSKERLEQNEEPREFWKKIEKQLRENPKIKVFGSLRVPRSFDALEVENSKTDIFCATDEPVYEVEEEQIDKLNLLLSNLMELKPTKINPFYIDRDDSHRIWFPQYGQEGNFLRMGRAYFNKEEEQVVIHLFPHDYIGWMVYTYFKSPKDWHDNNDWYDPPGYKVIPLKEKIWLANLKALKTSNPFHTEEGTWD